MATKSDVHEIRIRLPREVHLWIKREAEENRASMNSEVVRACQERMKRALRAAKKAIHAPPTT